MSASPGLMRPSTSYPFRVFTSNAPYTCKWARGAPRRPPGAAHGGARPSQARARPSGSDGIDTDVEAMFRRREQDSGTIHIQPDVEGSTERMDADDAADAAVVGSSSDLEEAQAALPSTPRPTKARAPARTSKAVGSHRQVVRWSVLGLGGENQARLQQFGTGCIACMVCSRLHHTA